MFAIVLQHDVEGKVSISLDAWTSSNNFTFMAIVAHYITKAGQLEELLIDFCEMDGAHTGANMAEATWDTLTRFGLENWVSEVKISCMYFMLTAQIMAFMTDNASNNNTLVEGVVELAKNQGIHLNATQIRLRCMPHTVHLMALKVGSFFHAFTHQVFYQLIT